MPGALWLTNRVANPVLRRLLRGPAGRRPGRSLAVIRYPGRRTGRPREVVVGYSRRGTTVWVEVGGWDRKVWWRNLRSPTPVEVWLAGEHRRATAVAVEESGSAVDAASRVRVRIDLDENGR